MYICDDRVNNKKALREGYILEKATEADNRRLSGGYEGSHGDQQVCCKIK
jgi:hypothetical protein